MHTGVPYDAIDPGVRELCRTINDVPGLRTDCSCEGHIPARGKQSSVAYVTIEMRRPTLGDYELLHNVANEKLTWNSAAVRKVDGHVHVRVDFYKGSHHDAHTEDPETRMARVAAQTCVKKNRRSYAAGEARREANTTFIDFLQDRFERQV